MSRSRRKSTFVVDNHGHNLRRRFFKKYYNKSLRNRLKNNDEVLAGNSYRKLSDSWNICDYRWYWSERMAIEEYYSEHGSWFYKRYPTVESWIKHYRKSVVYK